MGKPKTPNQKKAYKDLGKRLDKYVAQVLNIYDMITKDVAKIAVETGYSGGKMFRFSDYPHLLKSIVELQEDFVRGINGVVMSGTSKEWKESNLIQDLLAEKVLNYYDAHIYGQRERVYFQTNSDALRAFQTRAENGMNLSQKIWNQSENYMREMEYAISSGIEKGMSAVTLSKRLSQYLDDFPKLKADYTEKYGKAVDCLNAEYRSVRLARTEINMAYRAAENERWKQFDFILGYEVKLSFSHPYDDICDALTGAYPKDFVFLGWHPNCMCYTVPIVMDEGQYWDMREGKASGQDGVVNDVPDGFKKYVEDNQDRIQKASERGALPYWARDNGKYINGIDNLESYDSEPRQLSQNAHKPTKHGERMSPIPMKVTELDEPLTDNIIHIARLAGFSEEEILNMKPMPFNKVDNGIINSLSGKDLLKGTNCQICTVVFELRCRGLDVIAKGYEDGGFIEELSNNQTLAYKNKGGNHPKITKEFKSIEESRNFLFGSEMAKNGRYQLGINKWLDNADGHIFNIITNNGKLYVYDAQSNLRFDLMERLRFADFSAGVELLRVDKLLFDDRVINIFVKNSTP